MNFPSQIDLIIWNVIIDLFKLGIIKVPLKFPGPIMSQRPGEKRTGRLHLKANRLMERADQTCGRRLDKYETKVLISPKTKRTIENIVVDNQTYMKTIL